MRDKWIHVGDSLLALISGRKSRASSPLRRLPNEITLIILGMLDVVALDSLKLTCKRFFNIVLGKGADLDGAEWAITCLLEKDMIAKGPSAKRKILAKILAPTKPLWNTVLFIIMMRIKFPHHRYCLRNFPKRYAILRNSATTNERTGLELCSRIAGLLPSSRCLHWGERSIKDDGTGKQRCPACPKKCDICGHWRLKMLTRFGSNRLFESYRDLRLVKR